jgi:hypothetical protein
VNNVERIDGNTKHAGKSLLEFSAGSLRTERNIMHLAEKSLTVKNGSDMRVNTKKIVVPIVTPVSLRSSVFLLRFPLAHLLPAICHKHLVKMK